MGANTIRYYRHSQLKHSKIALKTVYQTTARVDFAKLAFNKLVSYDSNGFFIYIYKLFYFCYVQRGFSEPCKTSRMELICENS